MFAIAQAFRRYGQYLSGGGPSNQARRTPAYANHWALCRPDGDAGPISALVLAITVLLVLMWRDDSFAVKNHGKAFPSKSWRESSPSSWRLGVLMVLLARGGCTRGGRWRYWHCFAHFGFFFLTLVRPNGLGGTVRATGRTAGPNARSQPGHHGGTTAPEDGARAPAAGTGIRNVSGRVPFFRSSTPTSR